MKPYQQLLGRFFDPESIIELRLIHPDRKSGNLPKSKWIFSRDIIFSHGWMEENNKAGYGIYYGLLPRSESFGSRDDQTMPGRIVWADFDHVSVEEATSRANEKGFHKPSAVVNSGHGAHLYWFLDENQSPNTISAIVKAYANALGSDTSVSNPSRIFRMPGFINTKKPETMCELVHLSGHVYSLEQILDVAPKQHDKSVDDVARCEFESTDTDAFKRAQSYCKTVDGSGAGGRTNAIFRVACICSNDFGLSDNDSLILMRDFDLAKNCPPIQLDRDYPNDELHKILANAKKYHKKTGGEKMFSAFCIDDQQKKPIEINKPSIEIGLLRQRQQMKKSGKLSMIDFKGFGRLSKGSGIGRRGQLAIVAGPEGEGKSIFVMNLCLAAHSTGSKFAYLPLEDTRADWQERALAIIAEDWSPVDQDQDSIIRTDRLIDKYEREIESLSEYVYDNPLKVTSDDEVELVSPDLVIDWVRAIKSKVDIIVIDCLSQIIFDDRDQHRGEGKFIVRLEKEAEGKLIILVCHTRRKDSRERTATPHSDDVQGSKMIMRRAQVGIILTAHDEKSSNVFRPGYCEMVTHERTVYVAKARNADGKHMTYAYRMGTGGKFQEVGTINKGK